MSTIKIRSKRFSDYTLVRTLIAHPMETGRNWEPYLLRIEVAVLSPLTFGLSAGKRTSRAMIV